MQALVDDPMTQHWSRRSDAARRAFCDIYIRGSLSDSEPRLNFLSKGGGGAVAAIVLPDQKVCTWSGQSLNWSFWASKDDRCSSSHTAWS